MLRTLLFLLLAACCHRPAAAAPLRVPLSTAMAKNLVGIKAVATDKSYRGKGLRLTVTNKSGSALLLTADQGLIFSPEEKAQQDLVLAGAEVLSIAPFKEGAIDVQTFCAEATDNAPSVGQAYTFSRAADTTLVKVLQYLKRNFLLEELGQSAVWVVTNGYNPSTAFSSARDLQSRKLVDFLVSVTGRPADAYYAQYGQSTTPDQPVRAAKPLKIVADFTQRLEAPKTLTLGVYNSVGEMVQKVFKDQVFGRAEHRFRVEFTARDAAAGAYYIRLSEGATTLRETSVEIPE